MNPYRRGLRPPRPRRFNQWQQGFNRKGLLSNGRRKKKAFFLVRDFYALKRKETE